MKYISNLRNYINNQTRELGNRLYHGLGDSLTIPLDKEKLKHNWLILVLATVLTFLSALHGPSLISLIRFNYRCNKLSYTLQTNKKALLVQQHWGKDTQIMDYVLKKHGYECQLIEPSEATEKQVFDSIDQIARESNDKTQTVFYFAGHGDSFKRCGDDTYVNSLKDNIVSFKGSTITPDEQFYILHLNGNPNNFDESTITPDELFEALGKIKGRKAVIIDSCHSGGFVDKIKNPEKSSLGDIINNYVVIAACPANSVTFASPYYIFRKRISPLTYEIYNLASSSDKPLNLSKAKILYGNTLLEKTSGKFTEKFYEIIGGYSLDISSEMQRTSDIDFHL